MKFIFPNTLINETDMYEQTSRGKGLLKGVQQNLIQHAISNDIVKKKQTENSKISKFSHFK